MHTLSLPSNVGRFLTGSTILAQRTHAFAGLIVTDEGERRRLNVTPRRAELTAAVVAAVTNFLAVRTRRFPHFAATLAERFGSDSLPCSTVRALRRVAVAAFAAQWHPVAAPSAPRSRGSRTSLARYEIFIPAGGLGVHRTAAQALAAGFPSLSAWIDALANAQPTDASRYRDAVTFAARRAVMSLRGYGEVSRALHRDLVLEAESAIGEFIGRRIVRFPRLASRLLARFGRGTLPRSTDLGLRLTARIAVRERAECLAARTTITRARRLTVNEAGRVGRRIDALLVRVRATGTGSKKARRHAQAHAALLERYRADVFGAVAS